MQQLDCMNSAAPSKWKVKKKHTHIQKKTQTQKLPPGDQKSPHNLTLKTTMQHCACPCNATYHITGHAMVQVVGPGSAILCCKLPHDGGEGSTARGLFITAGRRLGLFCAAIMGSHRGKPMHMLRYTLQCTTMYHLYGALGPSCNLVGRKVRAGEEGSWPSNKAQQPRGGPSTGPLAVLFKCLLSNVLCFGPYLCL